jgi:hypothetical protein
MKKLQDCKPREFLMQLEDEFYQRREYNKWMTRQQMKINEAA